MESQTATVFAIHRSFPSADKFEQPSVQHFKGLGLPVIFFEHKDNKRMTEFNEGLTIVRQEAGERL